MRELDARANQLAHHLRALGVGPEVVVGLCVERSLDMIVGLVGILKAGGAYLPLDPAYPAERLAFMLEDAGAPVLVTQSALPIGCRRTLPASCDSMPTRRHRAPAHNRAANRLDPRTHRLCHLHLRLNRTAKGRRRYACGASPTTCGGCGTTIRRVTERRRAGAHGDQLRCRRMGGLACPL